MADNKLGLVGRKVGMTRIFTDDGETVPVTVLDVSNNRVTQVKTLETDGYAAVQVAYGSAAVARRQGRCRPSTPKRASKPARSSANSPSTPPRPASSRPARRSAWIMFAVGQKVDVTGVTIGKGFAGVIKRHHFSSNRATHGNSVSHNAPGSIGMAQDPGRVFPGKRMAGHLGDVQRTTQNLVVVRVDTERRLLLVKGAVPGAKGGKVIVRPAVKRPGQRSRSMELKLLNDNGQSTATVAAPDTLFSRDYNEALIHQIVVAYQANARQGHPCPEGPRGDVNKSTKKPWRQKGTGRARAGMTSSPMWRGGGSIFPTSPDENFSHKVNRKMYRAGMASILSQLLAKDDRSR